MEAERAPITTVVVRNICRVSGIGKCEGAYLLLVSKAPSEWEAVVPAFSFIFNTFSLIIYSKLDNLSET